jgi:hypothetical protein
MTNEEQNSRHDSGAELSEQERNALLVPNIQRLVDDFHKSEAASATTASPSRIAGRLAGAPAERRRELTADCVKRIAAESPNDIEGHLRLLTLYFLLYHLDRNAYQEHAASHARARENAIRAIEKQFPPTTASFDALDNCVRIIPRLIVRETTQEGMVVVRAFMSRIEQAIRGRRKEIPDFVASRIKAHQAVTKEQEEELAKQINVAEMIGKLNQGPAKRLQLISVGNPPRFGFQHTDGSRWYVDTLDDGAPLVALRQEGHLERMIAMPPERFMEALAANTLSRHVDSARKVAEEEGAKRHREGLQRFDIPHDVPTVRIDLIARAEFDPVAPSQLFSTMLERDILEQRYHAPRGEPPRTFECRPILFTDNPVESIRAELQRASKQYPRGFCVQCNLIAHGTPDRVAFEHAIGAADIAGLLRECGACRHLIVSGVPCFGGGLRQQMQKLFQTKEGRELATRLSLFLQTKPDTVNLATRRGRESPGATLYTYFFILGISQGRTFGEAARMADLETKRIAPIDAEALIDGELFSMSPLPIAITSVG